MPQPNVLILRAPGTNCDLETAFAFEKAGGKAELLHVNRLLETPELFGRFQILCLPGGFSYGDDVAAGRILGNQIQHHLAEQMARFKDDGKLILGICNGFQVLIKSGVLLDADAENGPPATLTWNDSGKFEDRWVRLAVQGTNSVFFKGIEAMYLPVAHAEGKFVVRDDEVFGRLETAGRLVLRYLPLKGPDDSDVPYPDNPNGSIANVAGICDETGRVLGLMPHPERHIHPTHHPRWTRGEVGPVGKDSAALDSAALDSAGDGLQMFINAVAYFA